MIAVTATPDGGQFVAVSGGDTMRVWVILCSLLLGCYSPDYQAARYNCTTSADCPPGLSCGGGVCGGTSPDLRSHGGPLPDGAQPDEAPACEQSLSGVGAGDFTIGFSVRTRSMAVSAILHQRASCDNAGDYWDIQMRPDGTLNIEVNQGGGPYASLGTTVPLSSGAVHKVLVQRRALTVQTFADGAPSGTISAPEALSDLAPLAGPDPCAARRMPLDGQVSAVCLYRGTP